MFVPDNATTDFLGRNFRLVHRHDGGADADGEAADDAAGAEHADVLGGGLDDGTDDPEDAGELEGPLAGEAVGDEGGQEGADEGARGHG